MNLLKNDLQFGTSVKDIKKMIKVDGNVKQRDYLA
jgi:hypothetical protein